jgi:diguanylate cyclase (GGDEF)-like protein
MFTDTAGGIEYDNFKNGIPAIWLNENQACGYRFLHREHAELAFLASFAREVGASLDPREVVHAAAKLLYKYFQYDLAVFSLPADSGGIASFSPLDNAVCMVRNPAVRESFPELKPLEINGYRHLGLATPGQVRVSGNYPTVVNITGDGMKIALYCGEAAEGNATHDILTGIAECLTTALRNAREHNRVKELSVRDSLTGLYNRRVLEEILSVEESKRTPLPLAMLILDVDDFKVINDTFGHPAGDRVLSVLGKLLQDNCRKENIVARYGGEEFAILMTNTGLTAAAALHAAERLRKVLSCQDFAFSGRKVRLTVSIGVAFNAGKTAAPESMMAWADQALYQAKRSGKNRVCFHEAPHVEKTPEKRERRGKLPVTQQLGGAAAK